MLALAIVILLFSICFHWPGFSVSLFLLSSGYLIFLKTTPVWFISSVCMCVVSLKKCVTVNQFSELLVKASLLVTFLAISLIGKYLYLFPLYFCSKVFKKYILSIYYYSCPNFPSFGPLHLAPLFPPAISPLVHVHRSYI